MGLVREVLAALDVTTVDLVGFEADDIIGTVAQMAKERGDDVIIVTGDRDSYQLVSDPHVKVLYNKRGVSDYALYDEAGILAKTGVTPELYPQYAALRGDPSGVPFIARQLANSRGPVIAASDYVRAVPESVRAFVPEGRRYTTLGTDGFGRSDTRAALRAFFRVDAASIVVAALQGA
jgi:hypothetical protein